MCDGKQMIQWDHTAAICATIINMHRDPRKGSPANSQKLNPYRNHKGGEKPMIKLNSKDSMKLLKRVFIDHAPPTLDEIQHGKI